MYKFTFHWKDGTSDSAEGDTVEQAFTSLGYGNGAIPALDYYEQVRRTPKGNYELAS